MNATYIIISLDQLLPHVHDPVMATLTVIIILFIIILFVIHYLREMEEIHVSI